MPSSLAMERSRASIPEQLAPVLFYFVLVLADTPPSLANSPMLNMTRA
jgi:hypothetical protein